MQQVDLIIAAEQALARESALAVLVKRPPAWWRSTVPGMFLFDFLVRLADTRRHTSRCMAVRKPALQAAQAMAEGHARADVIPELERGVAVAQAELWPVSERLHVECAKLAGLLADHYARLLGVEGVGYLELVGKAYHERAAYEAFLSLLDEAERRVEQILAEEIPLRKRDRAKLDAQCRELSARRRRESEVIFPQDSES
ncbi:MAG: NF038143 family protein [Proteobacteria bacterium]|nr:NF038143 family protein [Pseudomonadota bacterium]